MLQLDTYFINLGSVTMAHKAQKLLNSKGISATVGRLTSQSKGGCSYGVHVKGRNKEEVILLLRASSIKTI